MAIMTKYLCAIVLGLFLALFLILQVGAGEKVRLVHDDPFPPFAVYKDGRSEGIIIDILQEALKRVNIEPAFIPAHMDKTQDLVKSGDADGLALLGINPERRKLYDFSDPLLITGGALFVTSPNTSLRD
jgi:polar amino acid transport system substrate-binding protein